MSPSHFMRLPLIVERHRWQLALVASSLLLGACGKKHETAASNPPPLAVVGGEAITSGDLLTEISWRRANNHFVPAADVLLNEMVNRLATVQRARKSGLEKDPETKRRIESQLISRLRETEVDSQLKNLNVSDEEVAAAYQQRIATFTRKALDRYAILFQNVSAKASDSRKQEARTKLTEAVAKAKADPAQGGRGPAATGFGNLAIDYSEDQVSRFRGGDIGWIEEGAENTRIPKSLIESAAKREAGTFSEITEAGDGFYIIVKTDSRPGGARPLAEVSEQLRQTLLREKRETIEKNFVAGLLKDASPTINQAALSAFKPPASPATNRPPDSAEPPSFPGVSTAR